MRGRWIAVLVLAVAAVGARVEAGTVDSGVIRLAPAAPAEPGDGSSGDPEAAALGSETQARRGFDYEAFGSRLEGYWFQRKVYLKEGHDEEAARQADNIRQYVAGEGVRRLESPAGALVAEAGRFMREGNYRRALAALALAEALDPGRAQIRLLRARVFWDSGSGAFAAATELVGGMKAALRQVIVQPTLLRPVALVGVVALIGAGLLFSVLMAVRHNVALRHEVQEWMVHRNLDLFAPAAGWAFLLLPLVVWVGAGWIAVWWTTVTFRYMRRAERVVAVAVLLATALCVPLYRVAVGAYGLAADPKVRTTIAAAGGAYDPDRIVELKQLVAAYPEDPNYRFLLAGLYKNGRFYEDAFEEYKKVLALAPQTYQARINIGNIFFSVGQFGEAVAQYGKALELQPRSVLALWNTYQAQTESFRLNEAGQTLDRAQAMDRDEVARLMETAKATERPGVVDASIDLPAIWKATIEGRRIQDWLQAEPGARPTWQSLAGQLVNPLTLVALAGVLVCGISAFSGTGRHAARRCIRCGRPFCPFCKTGREGPEYCSQCVHLFVLGDGLAPETKSRKMYEIEAFDRRNTIVRATASLLLPGAGAVLRGRPVAGAALLLLWVTALVACVPAAVWPLERLVGLDVRLDLLRSGAVPSVADLDPALLIAVPLLAAVWLAGNLAFRRAREA